MSVYEEQRKLQYSPERPVKRKRDISNDYPNKNPHREVVQDKVVDDCAEPLCNITSVNQPVGQEKGKGNITVFKVKDNEDGSSSPKNEFYQTRCQEDILREVQRQQSGFASGPLEDEMIEMHDLNESIEEVDDVEEPEFDERSSCDSLIPIIIFSLFISSGGLIFGFDIGTVGGLFESQLFKLNYGDNPQREGFLPSTLGLLVSISALCACFGGLIPLLISSKIGIKPVVMLGSSLYLVGSFINIISTSRQLWMIVLGRIFQGTSLGLLCVVCPLLISELSPKFLSGRLISLQQLMTTIGIFLGGISLFLTSVIWPTSIWQYKFIMLEGSIFSILSIFSMVFVPESPQWLISHKSQKFSRARKSIARTRGLKLDDEKVDSIFNGILMTSSSSVNEGSDFDFERNSSCGNGNGNLRANSLWKGDAKRLITGMGILMLQQVTGINYFFYYGTLLFKNFGFNNTNLISIFLGGVNLLFSIISILTIDLSPRKTLLLVGSTFLSIFMGLFSTLGVLNSVANNTILNIIMVISSLCFIATFAMTWGPVSGIVVSSIYPQGIKVKAMAISGCSGWLVNFLITLLTPILIAKFQFGLGYLFCCFLIFSIWFVWWYVPEIKDKSFTEIDRYYQEM